jgi:aspartate/methionine/tyrosine aminotransferase
VALALTFGPGAEAVVVRGAYPSFSETLSAVGATKRKTLEEGSSPVCALANNPEVPSGRRFDVPSFIERCCELDAVPVVDEVYRHIVLDGGSEPLAAADLDVRAVSVSGFSKSLGYGGLRVGWIATRNEEVKHRVERWLQLITGGPSAPSNAAAVAAFDAFKHLVAEQQRRVLDRAHRVYEVLDHYGWTFVPPALGVAVVASPPMPVSQKGLQRALGAGYFVLPASVITGDSEDGAFRFSLLADSGALGRALRLLG